jgi:hypothetical protein
MLLRAQPEGGTRNPGRETVNFQLTKKKEPVEVRQALKAGMPNAGQTTLAGQAGKRGRSVEVSVGRKDSVDSWRTLEQNGGCASRVEEHS